MTLIRCDPSAPIGTTQVLRQFQAEKIHFLRKIWSQFHLKWQVWQEQQRAMASQYLVDQSWRNVERARVLSGAALRVPVKIER